MENMSYNILTPLDFISQIINDWWLKHIVPKIDELTIDNYEVIMPLIDSAMRFEPQGDDIFKWAEWQIIDNEFMCASGTILDIKDKRSMIFDYYLKIKLIVVTFRYIENEELPDDRLEGLQLAFVGTLGEYTIDNLINQIKQLRQEVANKGGIFDQILAKVDQDDWKL